MCQCGQRKVKESKGFYVYYDGELESDLVSWGEAVEIVEGISRTLFDDFRSEKVEVVEVVKVPLNFREIFTVTIERQ